MNKFSICVASSLSLVGALHTAQASEVAKRPNVVYVLADQWRYQALGCTGDKNVVTPNLDKLVSESVNFTNTYSCMSVSTPYRATMLTGQYSLTNGLFVNDVQLDPDANSIAKSYNAAGYNTGYIGKWHVNGNGRSAYIEPEHRQGFQYFKGLECSHNYNKSYYYDNNDKTKRMWEGYDVIAQTEDAKKYIAEQVKGEEPFMMILSWGPPHGPYLTAPKKYTDIYKDRDIELRPNVPEECYDVAIRDTKGYYAHIAAMDACVGDLQEYIKEMGIEENTIFVFTSDHGDMLYSHARRSKQRPYDESIHVPFILKYPAMFGKEGIETDLLFNTVDIMPTLLSMCDVEIPSTVEGRDVKPILLGKKRDKVTATMIQCITPFGEYERRTGGREYRGVRTKRYTYVRDLKGPWMLFDNEADPYQMNNLVNKAEYAKLQAKLEKELKKLLKEQNDEFLPGEEYIKKWGYEVDENGTVPYVW